MAAKRHAGDRKLDRRGTFVANMPRQQQRNGVVRGVNNSGDVHAAMCSGGMRQDIRCLPVRWRRLPRPFVTLHNILIDTGNA